MAVAAAHAPEASHPTTTGLNSRKMVFWAFLGSECMFFGSLIATYVVYRGRDTVGPHPHEILNIPFTSVSAFVLLMSSLTMVLALAAVQRGDLRGSRIWLAATALLGMTFIAGQCYEFTEFFYEGLKLHPRHGRSHLAVVPVRHGHARPAAPVARARRRDLRPLLALRGRRVGGDLHPGLLDPVGRRA